jgi:hypothetical protein
MSTHQDLSSEKTESCFTIGAKYQREVTERVVVVAGRKPYLTDTRFYQHFGFEVVDRTVSGFDLLCHSADESAPPPRFGDNAKRSAVSDTEGIHFEYAYQCPFVLDCLRGMSDVGRELGFSVTTRELTTAEEAQSASSPSGTFGAFLYGKLITHELMSRNKFRKTLEKQLAD